MKTFASLFLFWLFALAAAARELPKIPADDIAGTFRQTKTLSDMGVSLVSTGDFRVRKNKDLLWRTLKPVKLGFLLTPQGAYQIRGNEKTPLPPAATPLMRTLYAIFDAAFSGDEKTLSGIFEISRPSEEAVPWILVPKKKPLSDFILKIELRATADTLGSVTLFDVSGDVSRIEFFDIAACEENAGADGNGRL